MLTSQYSLDLNQELIVDNFAGGGGASTGIEMALGRHVDHAINHDRHALGMHRINHPQTIHHWTDVFEIDPATVCEGRPVGLAHFSPDCKHHSKAKGGKPVDKKIRGLVVVMLRWAKYGARVMTMENVEEIVKWGPLKKMFKKGKWDFYPDPDHEGRTWQAFLSCLSTGIDPHHPDLPEILEVLDGTVSKAECVRGFGYKYEAREIRAADFGTPTIRRRLFMVARRDGQPIVFPVPTHYKVGVEVKGGETRRLPWRTIAECIDWTRPCPSIFLTREQASSYNVKCKRPLASPTLRRIAMGIDRYVLRAKKPFLVNLTHQGGDRIEPTDQPANTITGANRGEKAVVAPVLSRFNGDHTGRDDGAMRNFSVTDSLTTQDTSNRFGLTEATLAAPFITEHANASSQRNMPADEAARTICGEVKGGHLAIVSANMVVNTTNHPGTAADSPAAAITTGGQQVLVTGTMVQTGYGEAEGQAPRALDPQQPIGTIVASGKHAVVTGTLIGAGGPEYSGQPKPVSGPMNTQTTRECSALATATLVHTAHGEQDKAGKKRRGRGAHDMQETMPSVLGSSDAAVAMLKLRGHPDSHPSAPADSPAHTLSTARNHGMIAAHLTKFVTGSDGQPATEPITTITAGSHSEDTHGGAASVHGIVAASVVRHFGQSVGQSPEEPAPTTVASGGGKTGVALAYMAQHNAGNMTNPGHPADEPISTVSTKGSQQQVVAASVAAYYKSGKIGQAADEPARAITTKARLGTVECPAVSPMTPEQIAGAHQVVAFLRAHGVKIDGEFATVAGYVIIDIGMRMLMPRELFRAQGFGENYIIDRAYVVDPHTGNVVTVHLTKEQQIRMCGNSVCPQPYMMLVRANVPELAVKSRGELKQALVSFGLPA